MELALNLVWAIVAAAMLGAIFRAARRGDVRVSALQAMLVVALLAFVLLPVISISDDFLAAHQTALPLSGQSWRLATEGSANGLDQLLAASVYLMLLMSFLADTHTVVHDQWCVRPLAARLAQSQRLRPPPSLTTA